MNNLRGTWRGLQEIAQDSKAWCELIESLCSTEGEKVAEVGNWIYAGATEFVHCCQILLSGKETESRFHLGK